MAKFIFVTGGVVSSLGKGITAASVGSLLKSRGVKVTIQKFDPYLNVDPGTMSPYQHGEVFVTEDGIETDLDLGHYERFIDTNLGRNNNVTAGQIYWSVVNKERKGDYLGQTIEVIPHVTDEIKGKIHQLAEESAADVVIIEVGGTVGNIENLPFLEAIRQFGRDVGRQNTLYIHVTLIPYLSATGELKTKPTQHSVKELRSIGIQPDVIVCRSDRPLTPELRAKIALFCDVDKESVIENINVGSIYQVPLLLEREGIGDIIVHELDLRCGEPDLQEWRRITEKMTGPAERVGIAMVGKYVALRDAYISIVEALRHGGIANDAGVDIRWVQSEEMERARPGEILEGVHGVLVPGGFGCRGVEGKINAIRYAREKELPLLGICLGMQCAVIEFARHVCGLDDANSTEFNPASEAPVIDLLPGQKAVDQYGGTMRLGVYPCQLAEDSLARRAYGTDVVQERHRHRWEVNNGYRAALERAGMRVAGVYPEKDLVEVIELKDHPWFVATQFHPEFKSRPNRAHPLFREFIRAALDNKRGRKRA